jgi:hypothetical protein
MQERVQKFAVLWSQFESEIYSETDFHRNSRNSGDDSGEAPTKVETEESKTNVHTFL